MGGVGKLAPPIIYLGIRSEMKVNAELDLKTGTTKDELIAALDGVPGHAVISVKVHTADRWGSDTYSLTLTWEVGNGKTVYNKYEHGSDDWGFSR
jgi:hypothetical protein